MMVKKSLPKAAMLVLLMALVTGPLLAQNTGAGKTALKDKKYYTEIFGKKELRKLKKADRCIAWGDRHKTKVDKLANESKSYQTLAEKSKDASVKAKAEKKAASYQNKAMKRHFKAEKYYGKGNYRRFQVYRGKLTPMLKDEYKAATELADMAEEIFMDAKVNRDQTKGVVIKSNLMKLLEAHSMEDKALVMQESAFMVLNGDKVDGVENPGDVAKDPNKHLSDTKNNYTDNQKAILPLLKVTNGEYEELNGANGIKYKADNALVEAEMLELQVRELRKAAEIEKDAADKAEYLNQANTIEKDIATTRATGYSQQVDAYKTMYDTYVMHFHEVRNTTTNPAKKLKASELEREAAKNRKDSEAKTAASLRMPKEADKAKVLGEAAEYMDKAIESQEKAYALYLNLNSIYSLNIPASTPKAKNDTAQTFVNGLDRFNSKTDADQQDELILGGGLREDDIYSTGIREDKIVIPGNRSGFSQKKLNELATKMDFVFLVQLGTLSKYPTNEITRQYLLHAESIKGSKSKVYRLGDFQSIEAAEIVKAKARKAGYKNAYVMAMIDGKIVSIDQSKKAIKNDKVYRWKYYYISRTEADMVRSGKFTGKRIYQYTKLKDNKGKEFETIDISKLTGLFYSVQLGTYQTAIDYDKLKDYQPLFAQKTTGGAIRYTSGDFTAKEDADAEKTRLQKAGFKDAYTVAFHNGQSIDMTDAMAMSGKTGTASKGAKSTKTTYSYVGGVKGDNKYIRAVDVKGVKGTMFTVQIGTFANPVPVATFKGISPIYGEKLKDGKVRYFSGNFNSFEQASVHRINLDKRGINGGYVQAYQNGKKISVTDAKASNKTTKTAKPKNSSVVYKIQVAAVSGEVNQATKDRFSPYTDKYGLSMLESESGATVIALGKCKTYTEAVTLKTQLEKEGFADGFIIAFKGATKISVADAKALTDK